MGTKVIIPPTGPVLSLAQLRKQLKYDPYDQAHPRDDIITFNLEAARLLAQHRTGISIGQQVLELALDRFPDGPIRLLQGPVTAIVSVRYIDTTGTEQTLPGSAYSLDNYSVPAWLAPEVDTDWPDTLECINAVKVRYNAGAPTLDGAVAQALLLAVTLWDQSPAGMGPTSQTELPLGVQALLDTVKDYSR